MGAVTGLEDQVGLILAVALLGATAWHLLGHRPLRVAAVVGAAGLVSAFAVTGLARAQFGAEQATAARYVYTAAPFVLLMACAWLGTLAPLEARRLRVALTVSVVLAVALVGQPDGDPVVAAVLPRARTGDEGRGRRPAAGTADATASLPTCPIVGRADLQIEGLPTAWPLGRPGRPLRLAPGRSAVRRHEQPARMEERALLWLVDPAFRVAPADGLPDGLGLPEFADRTDVTAAVEGSCVRVTPSGVAPSVTVRVPSGAVLHVRGGRRRARSAWPSHAAARSPTWTRARSTCPPVARRAVARPGPGRRVALAGPSDAPADDPASCAWHPQPERRRGRLPSEEVAQRRAGSVHALRPRRSSSSRSRSSTLPTSIGGADRKRLPASRRASAGEPRSRSMASRTTVATDTRACCSPPYSWSRRSADPLRHVVKRTRRPARVGAQQ